MSELPDALLQLARHHGIATEFWDWKGRHVGIPGETITHVLGSLGIDASTPETQIAALDEIRTAAWRRVVAPCLVVVEGEEVTFQVHMPAGESVDVEVRLESGRREVARQADNWNPDREVDGRMRGEATFTLGNLRALGYHEIVVTGSEGVFTSRLIVTPRYVGFPRAMHGKRVWGYAAQLYSVVSKRSWGLGDLQDLADLITWAGSQQSADYVLINPLHAAQPVAPMEPSPYLPSSRRFLNPIYIRPESIEEFHGLHRETRSELKKLRKRMRRAADPERLDRDLTWAAKREALFAVYREKRRAARQISFDAFRRDRGEALERFAAWNALSERFGANWREWPPEYTDVESQAVAAFAEANSEQVEFHAWLQWVAEAQLSAAQAAAQDAGMSVGVITDLAVGVNVNGAETWMMGDVFADGVTVGAPPDQYNQTGQDWGQPPWRPDRLEELAYEPFRAMVSAAISRAGGLRIDHIMGLFRLWWVPSGLGPRNGAYVRYNHEAMVGILALEAYRAQALVVGEDLGTVEPWVRDYLADRGILGTSVAWFEYGSDGRPLDPSRWREYCMASVTTHDLPPTLGYIRGDHVRLRDDLGLLTEPLEEEMEHADREQQAFVDILRDKGLLGPDETDPVEILVALHAYIRASPARVLQVALADAVGERRTQNQPGTIDEYPNWRVPLRDQDDQQVELEDIFTADLPTRIAAVMNGERTT